MWLLNLLSQNVATTHEIDGAFKTRKKEMKWQIYHVCLFGIVERFNYLTKNVKILKDFC